MREFLYEIKESIGRHSTLFTILVILTILFLGIVGIENPSGFVPALTLSVIVWTVMTLMAVGREFLKGILSVFALALVTATSAFVGTFVAPYTYLSSVWVLSTVGIWAVTLSISYVLHSSSSRWLPITISSALGFISTYFLLALTFNMIVSISVAAIIQITVFLIIYRLNSKTVFSKKLMPKNAYSEKLHETIEEACRKNGWMFSVVPKNGFPGNFFIIWDEKAYAIYPIDMEEQFSFKGRRQEKLAYKDRDISPWINRILYSTNPSWKSKKADVGLILLDVNRGNGRKSKLIATSTVGSRKKAVSAIVPGDKVKDGSVKNFESVISEIESTLGANLLELTESQYQALKKVGIFDDSGEEKDDVDTAEEEKL